MEKYFPESETLSIKRIKVAIEKQNWELLATGLEKALDMKNSGYRFKQQDLWQKLLLWAESENLPPELWEKLVDFVEKMSDDTIPEKHLPEIFEEYQQDVTNLIDKDVAIIYNQNFDKNTLAKVKKYRLNLNNAAHNPSKFSIEHKWMDELAELAAEFNEPQEDLKGFISLLSLFTKGGSIITSSYSANIHKMLVKANLNVNYPGIRFEADNSVKNWDVFTLGGTINSFTCTKCTNKIIKTEFNFMSLVECCNKCKSPMYPDMSYIGDNNCEVSPNVWYSSYEKLLRSRLWVIINPPSHNDQITLRNMLLEAAKNSAEKEVYIITPKFDVYELWRSKLSRYCHIRENSSDIMTLLETYNNNL